MANEKKAYTTYSDYETVKAEIMLQHSLVIDHFNDYRMYSAMKRNEKLFIPYLNAGKALRKLRHYATISGAWDEAKSTEKVSNLIKTWNEDHTKPSETIKKMDYLEEQFEEYFTKTNFYNLRIMEKHPGSALLQDKSY